MDWNTAMSYASGLSLGGHSGWRLPDKDELKGLYNSECKKLMDVRRDWYWSSTTFANDTDYAWFVDFNYGSMSSYSKSYNYYVRAVRDVQ